uniref:Small ribosomal subunit protein bS20c n=1 Tax=Astrosyne radiata TaxID=1158023 RepID=A0A2U9NT44_9STRA|nr:ribosomal protein S20 [Astrosyne radiata]AWT40310.1 ribosomal protein S20 [Astrosyne radiata]
MANKKSSIKRIKLNKRDRKRNQYYISSVYSLIKKFNKEIENYKNLNNFDLLKKRDLEKRLNFLNKALDKYLLKSIYQKNKIKKRKILLSKKKNSFFL